MLRRRRRNPASAQLLIALGLMAILNFAEPVIADGFRNELIKHEFLFNVTFDMCLIADVAVLLAWLASLRGSPDEPLAADASSLKAPPKPAAPQ